MDSPQDENQESSEPLEEVPAPEDVNEQPTPAEQEPHRPRADEALAAIRADLREEETKEQAGARGLRGLIQRIFRRKRPQPVEEVETPSRLDALQFPEPPPAAPITSKPAAEEGPVVAEAAPPELPAGQGKPDFQALVRDRLTEAWSQTLQREPLEMEPPAGVEEEVPEGPTHSILTSLRQKDEEVTEEPVDYRQETLEDYVVATEEPEESGAPAVRRLKTSWRYMRPTEKRLLIGALLIVALAMLAGSSYLVFTTIGPTLTPTLTPTPSVVPIPVSVSLPGGWVFPLGVGNVPPDGLWKPKGPEWLAGTEITRWVALPWTVQLEAVLRTLKADDEIQLSMSNYDSIVYKVKSIEQVPSDSIDKLASGTPSLLLILYNENTDTRWVVTAKP